MEKTVPALCEEGWKGHYDFSTCTLQKEDWTAKSGPGYPEAGLGCRWKYCHRRKGRGNSRVPSGKGIRCEADGRRTFAQPFMWPDRQCATVWSIHGSLAANFSCAHRNQVHWSHYGRLFQSCPSKDCCPGGHERDSNGMHCGSWNYPRGPP